MVVGVNGRTMGRTTGQSPPYLVGRTIQFRHVLEARSPRLTSMVGESRKALGRLRNAPKRVDLAVANMLYCAHLERSSSSFVMPSVPITELTP